MRRLLIVLAVLVACMAPNAAYAQDVSLVDSFTSGVGTWGSEQREEEMDSDSSVKGIESGDLLAAPAEEVDTSVFGYIQSWVSSLRIRFGNAGNTTVDEWWLYARWVLAVVIIPIAVLLVFMWWGVRKALRMIMTSFRRGRANV